MGRYGRCSVRAKWDSPVVRPLQRACEVGFPGGTAAAACVRRAARQRRGGAAGAQRTAERNGRDGMGGAELRCASLRSHTGRVRATPRATSGIFPVVRPRRIEPGGSLDAAGKGMGGWGRAWRGRAGARAGGRKATPAGYRRCRLSTGARASRASVAQCRHLLSHAHVALNRCLHSPGLFKSWPRSCGHVCARVRECACVCTCVRASERACVYVAVRVCESVRA
jgi:hypothetical protein